MAWIFGGLDEVDQWNSNGKGWEQGALEHGKEICSSSSPNRCSRNQTSGQKREKPRKEKAAKTRVSQLVIHLVDRVLNRGFLVF